VATILALENALERSPFLTHLDQSNYLTNQQQVGGFGVPFTSLSKMYKNAGPKPFCSTKPACFDFSHLF